MKGRSVDTHISPLPRARARATFSRSLSLRERGPGSGGGEQRAQRAPRAAKTPRSPHTPRTRVSRERRDRKGNRKNSKGLWETTRARTQRRARGVRALWPVGLEGVLYMSNAKAQVRKLFKKLVSVLPTAHSHAHATHTHTHTASHCALGCYTDLAHSSHPATQTSYL